MTAQWAGRLPVPGKTPTRTTADRQNLEGLDVGELTDAGTQVGDATLARPDLAVYDRERKERVLMEAKFWAGLTENQPNAYLARLPLDQRPAVLLFVAPEARLETLWPELRRLIEPPFDWQPVETSRDTEIKCALVDGATRYLVLASWRALLNRMLSFAMSSGDSIKADIRETPLWITFHYWDGVITVDELRDRLGNDIWANTPDSIPFHLPTGVEYDKVLADVVERLVSITTQIAAEEAP